MHGFMRWFGGQPLTRTNLCLLALKGTSMHINPSVVIMLLSNSDVTQSFMLVPLNLPREKKKPVQATQFQYNETLRK